MKIPRFSIRELFMITAIVALALPYVYQAAVKQPALDLSYNAVQQLVSKIEPTHSIISGTGGTSYCEMTLVIPSDTADTFVPRFQDELYKTVQKSGWVWESRAETLGQWGPGGFLYRLKQGRHTARIQFVLANRNKADEHWSDLHKQDMEELHFYLIGLQSN